MSDPAHPKQTATLTRDPDEVAARVARAQTSAGLLAAVHGQPGHRTRASSRSTTLADCRHPQLQSTAPVARLGHESGFSPDGKTFYATGTAIESITAVDVTDPKNPHAIWQGNVVSHGMTLSRDGNRAYVADAGGTC